ncbi:extracellular solute-binding protein [Halorientalis brevis]|uniref:Extracellular solute-binding protein n=1 Tax=Halorientalis brevis TaxID=1126241 RepID=A0ABD6CC52_9EURY|nr:extracellular solute-binding protein [Halorientalis brevis]
MELSRRALLGTIGGATIAGVTGVTLYGEVGRETEDRTTALVAGSLLAVANEVPGATVEAHGSAAVRRLILDGHRDPDAVALADPTLFEGISSDATLFATNSLVLAYNPESDVADDIRRDWQAAVQDPDVGVGRTDPDLDPLGYRTVMALELAANRTDIDADRVLANATTVPETDLLNVLEGGELDAAFAYRNMAVQRDLPAVSLPTWMNFSDPEAADQYGQVTYDLGDKTVRGAPIRYGATALTEAGQSWIERLVTGTERLERMGFSVPQSYPDRDRSVATVGGE